MDRFWFDAEPFLQRTQVTLQPLTDLTKNPPTFIQQCGRKVEVNRLSKSQESLIEDNQGMCSLYALRDHVFSARREKFY